MSFKTPKSAVIAVIAALGLAMGAHAARTVSVSQQIGAAVTLAFGGESDAAENVYLAYGPADCGGRFHAWPNKTLLGTVAADATTMTCELPSAITTGTYYRFFVGDKPYDYEVEYIKGDGTSWINTDYVPSSANKVEMTMLFESFSSGAGGYEAFFCARNTSSKSTFMAIHIDGNIRIDRLNSVGIKTIKAPATWTKYLFKVDYTGGAVETNLVSATTGVSGTAYTAGGKLALFTDHSMGNNVTSSMQISHPGRYRLYSFKLLDQSDNLVLDLVPVVSNNVACLYDRQRNMMLPRCGAAGGGFTHGREIAAAVASTETRVFGALSVDSVNYTTGDVTVSFPALAGDAALWAVYSTGADYGAYSPNGWDRYEKIADIAAGDTTCSAVLPALAGVNDTYSYKYIRLVVAPATVKPTPFDRQVEYIKSPSAAGPYINTKLGPLCTDRVVAKVAQEQAGTAFIWSARIAASSTGKQFSCLAMSDRKFRFDRNGKNETKSSLAFTLGETYDLDVDYNTQIYEIQKCGSRLETARFVAGGTFTPGSSLIIGGANNNGTVSSESKYLRFYDIKLIDSSGTLKLDLIPVTTNGVGCLYDKVSGAVFGNAGTGAFEIGGAAATRYGMEPLLVSAAFRDERTADAPAYARMVSDGAGGWAWKFYTLEMEEIASPAISLPDSAVTVLFGSTAEVSALLADRTANGWTAGGCKMTDFVLASDGYTFPAGFDFSPIEGLTLDLAGHDFTLPASMRDAGVAFTVTDTSAAEAGGELTIDVGDGAAYTNDLIALSGSLALVKTGGGEFYAAKVGQSYAGGTTVSNGTFVVGADGTDGAIGSGGTVTVGAGAVIDMNGKIGFLDHPFVLAGGTLANSALRAGAIVSPTLHSTISNLTLVADSSILFAERYGLESQEGDGRGRLDLGGRTLSVSLDGNWSSWFDMKDATVTDGRIVTARERATISFRGVCVATNDVALTMNSAFCTMGTSVLLEDYRDNCPASNYSLGSTDKDVLSITGSFTPATDYWHGLTMLDGSTLDLSERTGAMAVVSQTGNASKTLRFADGATVTVVLTNRADLAAIAASNAPYVVTWTSTNLAPANVTFALDAETAAAGYAIAQDEYGIVLADAAAQATPVYAKMVKGEDDAYAWRFYNSLWADITATAGVAAPNAGITVWFGSGAELAAIDADRAANGWTAKGYHTTGFDIPSDGCGVSSATANLVISENAVIDLKGHDFTLPQSLMDSGVKFTVTDSSPAGEGGVLTVVVDAGVEYRNYDMTFTGSLSFDKRGGGHFIEKVGRHSYTGDVLVSEGRLRLDARGDAGVIGAPCAVTVEEGAALDFCGRSGYGGFQFVLDGGMLVNGMGYSTDFTANTSITDVRLTKDSAISMTGRYGLCAAGERTRLDLGGHTLTITNSTYFDLVDTTIENGTIETFGSGNASTLLLRHAVAATNNVTFIIHNNINFYGDADTYTDLANYVAKEDNVGIASFSTDSLRVWGSFVPYSPKYHGLTLMDGATLDLSNYPTALAACSTGGSTAHAMLKFAEGATIKVNVGGRSLRKGDYLVTWKSASKPANLDTVKFTCSGGRSFRVEVDDDGEGNGGLRFIPSGFTLIVK